MTKRARPLIRVTALFDLYGTLHVGYAFAAALELLDHVPKRLSFPFACLFLFAGLAFLMTSYRLKRGPSTRTFGFATLIASLGAGWHLRHLLSASAEGRWGSFALNAFLALALGSGLRALWPHFKTAKSSSFSTR